MDDAARHHFRAPAGKRALFFGLLAGPIAWAVAFQAIYSASAYLCDAGWPRWPLLGVLAAALVVTGLALRTARRSWVAAGRPRETEGEGVEGRTRALALGGIGVSIFFLVVIAATAVPILLLDACRR